MVIVTIGFPHHDVIVFSHQLGEEDRTGILVPFHR